MKKLKLLALSSILCTSAASADPGLGSLRGLLPIYVIVFLVILLLIYILPVWLIFRARRRSLERKLSKKKLILHITPAAAVGIVGVFDFFVWPIYNSLFFDIFADYSHIAFYLSFFLSIVFIYLAGSTYRKCNDVA